MHVNVFMLSLCNALWHSTYTVWLGSLMVSVSDPITARSGVRLLTIELSSNNPGQVVRTQQPVVAMLWFGGPADQ